MCAALIYPPPSLKDIVVVVVVMAATVWAGLVQNAGVENLDKIAVAWTDQSARVHMGEGMLDTT